MIGAHFVKKFGNNVGGYKRALLYPPIAGMWPRTLKRDGTLLQISPSNSRELVLHDYSLIS